MRMRFTYLVPAVALVLGAAAALGLRGGAAPAAETGSATTITLFSPAEGGGGGAVDVGRKGVSIGDYFLGTNGPLLDPRTRAVVGRLDSIETILGIRRRGTVAVTLNFRLAHGTVLAEGVARHARRVNVGAVTGGTGAYAGARGTVTAIEQGERGVRLRLRLLP